MPPNTPSTEDKDVVYIVITGSYCRKGSANKLVKELQGKGYDSFLLPYSV